MRDATAGATGTHHLLRPINLRLEEHRGTEITFSASGDLSITTRLDSSRWDPLEIIPLGLNAAAVSDLESAALSWDRLTVEERDPATTAGCLWDLVDLPTEGAPPEFTRGLIAFVRKWGVLDEGRAGPRQANQPAWHPGLFDQADQPAWANLQEWHEQVLPLKAILTTLVATEAGELVDEDLFTGLWAAISWEALPEEPPIDWRSHRPSPQESEPRRLEFFRQLWRTERAAGRGLQLQRQWVVIGLRGHLTRDLIPYWDQRGRGFQTQCDGAYQIVISHLTQLFTAKQLDVFACSVCGKPYPFQEAEGRRRPRRGTRNFCSDACRTEGKRQDNLAAWHRNKENWRTSRKETNDGR